MMTRSTSDSGSAARSLAALCLVASTLALVLGGPGPAAARDEPAPREGPALGQVLLTALAKLADGLVPAPLGRPDDLPIWDWPLAGRPSLVHRFDAPAQRWLPGHRGIDLGGRNGGPVRAVADGVVAYSGIIAGVGVVSVQHPDGLRSTYQPVQDRVGRGEHVRSGQPLGTLGTGGHCVVRTCLHLGAKRGEGYLDPLLLLQAWEVSLLPMH